MAGKKISLLNLLLRKNPEYTREEYFALVLCGDVSVDGQTIKNPREIFSPDSDINIKIKKYVSRGGYKLEIALTRWEIPVIDSIVLDAGCSTGGFTDCLLQAGAKQVHAVDVGYNQLAYSLRTDPRVFVREKTNIMELESLDPVPDFAVADLSFRSIRKVASHMLTLVKNHYLVLLIKPQFEMERDQPDDFDGVLKDQDHIRRVVRSVLSDLRKEGAYPEHIVASPIQGRKGNQEFLVLVRNEEKTLLETLFEELDRELSLL